MLIDSQELTRRISSQRNILNAVPRDTSERVPLRQRQPQEKRVPVPKSLQIVAGVLAKTEGVSVVAEEFGIRKSVVSAARNGKGDQEVAKVVEDTSSRIRDMALDKLMASLGIIDDEKLADCNAKDASTVARNLATVVGQLSPKHEGPGAGVQLVIYAPQVRPEDRYETLDVKVG